MWKTRFRSVILGVVAIAVLGLLAAPALAQDAPSEERLQSTFRDDIGLPELRLRLKPLTQQKLEVEARAWQQILRDAQVEISGVRVANLELAGAELAAQHERLAQLVSRRTRIYDRNKAILAELRLKGGDPKEFETYANAITTLAGDIDLTDASSVWRAMKDWSTSEEGGLRWAANIGKFLLVMLVAWIVAKIASRVLRRLLNTSLVHFSEMLDRFFVTATRNLVLAIGVLVALTMLEVEVGPLLAAMGVIGFILGFALQETLGNFAAGLMLLLYRPYDIGHFVRAAGEMGKVASMNLVSTTLLTPDNQRIVVPNGKIWGGTITNVTGSDQRRVDLKFGIAYGDDIEHAKQVLTELVVSHEKVLDDPAPVIRVHELGDSSVNFVVRPWVKTADYWDVHWDITQGVKQRFDAAGITIPFPQREVHVTSHDPAEGPDATRVGPAD